MHFDERFVSCKSPEVQITYAKEMKLIIRQNILTKPNRKMTQMSLSKPGLWPVIQIQLTNFEIRMV